MTDCLCGRANLHLFYANLQRIDLKITYTMRQNTEIVLFIYYFNACNLPNARVRNKSGASGRKL